MIGQVDDGQKVAGWNRDAAQKLKSAVQEFGTQQGVADAAGISRPSLVEILQGRSTPKRKTLAAICSVIGANPRDFTRRDIEIREIPPERSLVEVREVDFAYGMGGTFVDDLNMPTVTRELPRDWVRSFTRAHPDQLFLCKGIGDSMMPTLLDSDLLLVDQSQEALKQSDRIWVVAVGEVGMVKRVRVQADGNVAILSDNSQVPEMIVTSDEIRIVGRVVAVIRKM